LSGLDYPFPFSAGAGAGAGAGASTWSEPNQEDWTLFMSKVDELLNFVSPEGL